MGMLVLTLNFITLDELPNAVYSFTQFLVHATFLEPYRR